MTQLARQLFGLPIPDEGALFDVALAGHIAAGLTCVITGALAATAPKRPGRHPLSGPRLLLVAGGGIRLLDDHGRAALCPGLAPVAHRHRRLRGRQPGLPGPPTPPARWLRVHIPAMGGSYIALFTGFYVDNGPHLPLWDRLPSLAYWLLPSLVGVPLILRAMTRRRRLSVSRGPRGRPHSGAQPGRPG
jgi:hypothetical protein